MLLRLDGEPLIVHSVRTVLNVAAVHRVVLVIRPEDRDEVAAAVAPHLGSHDLWLVDGGAERHDSEWRALQALAPDIEAGELDVVAIHDAARPLASSQDWAVPIHVARDRGGAVPVVSWPRLSTRDGRRAPPGLVGVQTPQAFRAGDLLAAYRRADEDGFTGTDTASCLERYAGPGFEIRGTEGSVRNVKVTFPEDVALAETLLSRIQARRRAAMAEPDPGPGDPDDPGDPWPAPSTR